VELELAPISVIVTSFPSAKIIGVEAYSKLKLSKNNFHFLGVEPVYLAIFI
jgi:hypothetical protein